MQMRAKVCKPPCSSAVSNDLSFPYPVTYFNKQSFSKMLILRIFSIRVLYLDKVSKFFKLFLWSADRRAIQNIDNNSAKRGPRLT